MKNSIALFFTFLTFFASFSSCSVKEDSESFSTADFKIDISSETKMSVDGINSLKDHIQSNRSVSASNIDQNLIDEYSAIAGLDEGSVTLEFVEAVAAKFLESDTRGLEAVLVDSGMDEYSASLLKELSTFNFSRDFKNEPAFLSLSEVSKAEILLAEAVMLDFHSQNRAGPGQAAGALVGLAIGGTCCGVVGAVVGVIVGALVGHSFDKQ